MERDDTSIKSVEMERINSQRQGTILPISINKDDIQSNMSTLEQAFNEIGFGRFQWGLTLSCSFGFLVDQMLLVSISLTTPQSALEFGPKYQTLLSASLYAGLFAGALLLGGLADIVGRRLVWHGTIFGVSIFGLIAAASPNWAALNVFQAILGFLGGGNLAIDLAILAESIPPRWSFILSGLASIWGIGNAITGLIAWPLLVNFGCASGSDPSTCPKSANMGWRYLYIIIGGLSLVMSFIRALVLRSRESPGWLISCGRIDEAVSVLNSISATNKSEYRVRSDQFIPTSLESPSQSLGETFHRARKLFVGPKQLRLVLLMVGMWAFVGIAYPLYTIFLPYYLAAHGAQLGNQSNYITYRDWAISSVVGIFGPCLSMWMVSTTFFRSRRSLFITGAACAAFSGAFTSVRTEAQNLAFSCMVNFWLNAVYAIIY
ncbi:sugar transporter, partial [Penicillium argentinense]